MTIGAMMMTKQGFQGAKENKMRMPLLLAMAASLVLAGCYSYRGPNYRDLDHSRNTYTEGELAELRTAPLADQYRLTLRQKIWINDYDRPSENTFSLDTFHADSLEGKPAATDAAAVPDYRELLRKAIYGYWRFAPGACQLGLYNARGRLESTLVGRRDDLPGLPRMAYLVVRSKRQHLVDKVFHSTSEQLFCTAAADQGEGT